MFRTFLLVNAFCLYFSCSLSGEIIETHHLAHVEEIAGTYDNSSLILFDVDGVLIAPDDAILKPYRKHLFDELIAGHPERDLFRDIHLKAPHSLVDQSSIALLQKLQTKGIPTLAFTAAPSKAKHPGELGDWRIEELLRFGFDFRLTFPELPLKHFPKDPDQPFIPLYKSGILFSSLHPKGKILIHFLQHLEFRPNKVLFIDDDIKYVQSVVGSLEEVGIPCIGIHYTACRLPASPLDLERARFQVNYFLEHDIWLDDKACDELYSNSR